jgi:hypothetical protein
MEIDWILRLILFAVMHWILAAMMLHDLAYRRRVLGGRKWPWAVIILLVTFLGSLLYLVCHPRIIIGGDHKEDV